MPSKCFVPGCLSNYNASSKVRIFSFPRDEELKKNWLKAINREDNREPSKFSKVCERHFLPGNIVTESNALDPKSQKIIKIPLQKHRLVHDAVPTLLLNIQHVKKRRHLPKPSVVKEHPVDEENFQNFPKETVSDMKVKDPRSISISDVSKDSDDEFMDDSVLEESDLPSTTDRPFIEMVKLDNSKELLTADEVFDDTSPLKSSPISKPSSASKSPSSNRSKHFLPSPYKHLESVSVLLKPEDKINAQREFSKSSKRSLSTCSNSSIGSNEASKLQQKRRKVEKPAPTVLGQSNDGYCWVCHRENVVLSCLACPRAYHQKCAGEIGSASSDWVCPECQRTLTAENVDSRSSVLSEISLDKLCTLLRFSLNKMKHRAGVAFLQPVSLEHYPMYLHYVIHPMDFSLLEKNIKEKRYGCTEAFLSDVKWIYHNSCVFNGSQHPLSTNAKSIVKACDNDMQEIEVCPDCFMHNIVRHKYWFSEVCQKPHPLVWAKLKGFPYWPAKVVRIADGNIDARFFGAHDRAWVPISQCYHLSKEMPTSSKPKKKGNYETALDELNVHVQLLIQKYGTFQYAPYRTVFDAENKHLAYHGINMDLAAKNEVKTDIASIESTLLEDRALASEEIDDSKDTDGIQVVGNQAREETLSGSKLPIEKDNAILSEKESLSEAGQSSPNKNSPSHLESLHRKKIEMALQRIKGYVTNDLDDEENDSLKEGEEEASTDKTEVKSDASKLHAKTVALNETADSSKSCEERKSEPKESTLNIPTSKDDDESSDKEDDMCLADLIKARALPPIDLPTYEDTPEKETPAVLEPSKKNDSFSLKLLETIESCKAKLGISSDLEKSDSDSEEEEEDMEEEESEIEDGDREGKRGSNEDSMEEDASEESSSSDEAESGSSNTDIETVEESEAAGVEKPSEEDPLGDSCSNSVAEVSKKKAPETSEKGNREAPETEEPEPFGKEVPGPSEKEVPGPSEKEVPKISEKQVTGPSEKEVPGPSEKEVPGPSEKEVPKISEKQVTGPSEKEVPGPSEKEVPRPSEKEVTGHSERKEQETSELPQTLRNETLSKEKSTSDSMSRSIAQMEAALEKLRHKIGSTIEMDLQWIYNCSGNNDSSKTATVADCDNVHSSIPTDTEIAMQPSPVARSRSVSSNALQTSTDELTDTDLQMDAVEVQVNSDQNKELVVTDKAPVSQSASVGKPEEEEEMVDEDLYICPPVKPPTPPLICLDDGTETEPEPEDKDSNSNKDKSSIAGPLSTKLPPPKKEICPENTDKYAAILKRAKLIPQNARKSGIKRPVRSVTSEDSSDDEIEVRPRPSKVPTSGAIRTFNRERTNVVSPQINNQQFPVKANEINLRPADKSTALHHSRDSTSLEDQEEEEISDASYPVVLSAATLAQKDAEIARLKKKLSCIYSAFQLQQWKSAQEKTELRHNMNLIIMEMRASLEADKKQTVDNITQTLTREKQIGIAEAKKKQWCAYCRLESRYACCWNTSYCTVSCQKHHFNEHRHSCTQLKPKLNVVDGNKMNTSNPSDIKEQQKVILLNVVPNKDAKLSSDSSKENASQQAVPSKVVLVPPQTSQTGPSIQYMLTSLKPSNSPISMQQKASTSKADNSDFTEPSNSQENLDIDNQKNPENPSFTNMVEASKEEPSLEEIYFPSPPAINFEGLDTALPDENVHFEENYENAVSENELTIVEESSAEEDILLSDNDNADQEMVTIGRDVVIKAKYLKKCLIFGKNATKLTRYLVDVVFPNSLLVLCSAFGNKSHVTKLTRAALPHYKLEAIIDYVLKRFPTSSRSEVTLAINMKCQEARAAAGRAESGVTCRKTKLQKFKTLLAKERQEDTKDQDSKPDAKAKPDAMIQNQDTNTNNLPSAEVPRPQPVAITVYKNPQPGIVRLKSPSSSTLTGLKQPANLRPILIRPNYGIPPRSVGPPNSVMLAKGYKPRAPTVRSLLRMQQPLGNDKKLVLPLNVIQKAVMANSQGRSSDGSAGTPQRPIIILGSPGQHAIAPAPVKPVPSTDSKLK